MTEAHTDLPITTERFERALAYATQHHRHQLRKGTPIPYVSHLLAVASIVLELHGDEDEAIGGLLHDVVEDGGGEAALAEIRRMFGSHVAEIVLANTDTALEPKPPWRARKEAYVTGIARKAAPALRVSLADKLHNLRAINRDHDVHGDALWARFKAGEARSVLWYYAALADALEGRRADLGPEAGPFLDELHREVARLRAALAG
jgi:GTP pyrophosphokinase